MGRLGTGTVHHIAWRTPDDAQQLQWRSELVRLGYNVTPVIDRNYFHSLRLSPSTMKICVTWLSALYSSSLPHNRLPPSRRSASA